jgi:hypothetical protein
MVKSTRRADVPVTVIVGRLVTLEMDSKISKLVISKRK